MKMIHEESDSKVKHIQKNILKEIGLIDVEPSYDRTLKCYTLIKVLTEEQEDVIPVKYLELIADKKLKGGVRNYEGDIWIFKLFI